MEVVSFEEPFKKLINQGMILGRSSFVYLVHMKSILGSGEITDDEIDSIPKKLTAPVYVSKDLIKTDEKGLNSLNELAKNKLKKIISSRNENLKTIFGKRIIGLNIDLEDVLVYRNHADISYVNNDKLDVKAFKNWREEYKNTEFITNENGDYICGSEIEKMSKSKYNVQTPDELVEKFGADTLRCYEMFLGPLEQAKPWDTQGINGVNNFLRKLWRLFHQNETFTVTEGEADKKALKSLHTAIKNITSDIERFSFNTVVSNLMIAVNELTSQKCNNKNVLESLLILASPYAPHITEELWNKLGNTQSISTVDWPEFNAQYLVEANHSYPVSFNGKMPSLFFY